MKPYQNARSLTLGAGRIVFAITLLAMCGSPVVGQDRQPHDLTAPPPVKVISSAERDQLNQSKDSKSRVKTSLVLAEAHLEKAEAHTAGQAYNDASAEAARYWAIVENAFAYVRTLKPVNNKTRDLFKRLELALRSHGPRLSGMRRSTPAEYSVWIKEIEDSARAGRTEALNSFYGDTVIRDAQRTPQEKKPIDKPTIDKPLQENSVAPRPKPL